eukprot:CAMPEP_0194171952 /NCGR_PEP_ID=MMETSP0154-20130528/6499_1 /TAXON_ID=1049557 /ORGANISM="Thalassiothrix antarctica, Strain L6-D1" /LENGTH=282 /DNA_ID=CAMNT_0038884477 /DNA_START=107 /DNA_END=955 /DNA_ORIENTATION=+
MLFNNALALTLLLSGAAAFNVAPKNNPMLSDVNKNIAGMVAAGVISAAALLPGAAMAADSLVVGTPLETKLSNFGEASYPVFNSIKDVSPIADSFLGLVNTKVKAADASEVAKTAVDGLLAIPDSSVLEYRGVLRQVVYSGVKPDTCVTLGGSGSTLQKFANSDAVKSVDSAKFEALKKKFAPANSAVPTKNGDICLPGSAAASEKLWVAQAELTFSMPKTEANALVASIAKAGKQATRPTIATLVSGAESVFSKSPEAIKMVAAGKDVEPSVIATAKAALK